MTIFDFLFAASPWVVLICNMVALYRYCKSLEEKQQTPVDSRKQKKPKLLPPSQLYNLLPTLHRMSKLSIFERHKLTNCDDLLKQYQSNKHKAPPLPLDLPKKYLALCYGCNAKTEQVHSLYCYSCPKCGDLFHKMRAKSSNLGNKVALVIGGRTKLGHQVALKLLEAGATVFITTRFAKKAADLFQKYKNQSFAQRLIVLELDLQPNASGSCQEQINSLVDSLKSHPQNKQQRLDILINCAAQTIACRERQSEEERNASKQKNRYGDALHVDSESKNSWGLQLEQVDEQELRDVFNVNVIGIWMLTVAMLPLLAKCNSVPFIINVHAREGLLQTHKSRFHAHTNAAKASLHMMTRMLCEQKYTTKAGKEIAVHGVDPGWFSIDEYYEDKAPMQCPPLDEIDAAARICYPIFENITTSEWRTRRHFVQFRI